jgi:hypothetical protein
MSIDVRAKAEFMDSMLHRYHGYQQAGNGIVIVIHIRS